MHATIPNIIRATLDSEFARTDQHDDPAGMEDRLRDAVQSLGDSMVDDLVHCLDDDDVGIRAIALILLGESHDPRAVHPIVTFVHDDRRYEKSNRDPVGFRVRLLQAFSPWWRTMTAGMEHNERLVDMRMAAHALGLLGTSEGLATLEYLKSYPIEKVRETATEALAKNDAS